METRYMINYKYYNDKYWHEGVQTQFLIKALYKIIILRLKYDIVDFNYRK